MKTDRYLQEARDHITSSNAVFFGAISDMMDTLDHHDDSDAGGVFSRRSRLASAALSAMRTLLIGYWDGRQLTDAEEGIARLLDLETRLAVEDKADELSERGNDNAEHIAVDNKERAADIRAGGFFT